MDNYTRDDVRALTAALAQLKPDSAESPLKRKIRAAYKKTRQYHDLLALCFPASGAHRCAAGGGPPACAMPFGKALREMGGGSTGMGSQRMVWIPSLPNAASEPRAKRVGSDGLLGGRGKIAEENKVRNSTNKACNACEN